MRGAGAATVIPGSAEAAWLDRTVPIISATPIRRHVAVPLTQPCALNGKPIRLADTLSGPMKPVNPNVPFEFGICLTAKNTKSTERMWSFSSQADNQAITRRVSRNPTEMSHIPLSLCSLRCLRLTSTAPFRFSLRCLAWVPGWSACRCAGSSGCRTAGPPAPSPLWEPRPPERRWPPPSANG